MLSTALKSGEGAEAEQERHVEWDEANLREHELSVLRGEYGTMRIDEPKTPFVAGSPAASEEGVEFMKMHSEVEEASEEGPSGAPPSPPQHDASLDAIPGGPLPLKRPESERPTTLDGIVVPQRDPKQRRFEEKRKTHYNMRNALQQGRLMMMEEDEDDEDDE